MFVGNLNVPASFKHILQGPTWRKALDWLREFEPANRADGEYEIQGRNMYAIVMTYLTKTRDEARPELHHKFIDLQFIVEGREIIEYELLTGVVDLNPNTDYDEDKDVIFYPRPFESRSIPMITGSIAVFTPSFDIHMPGLNFSTGGKKVRKVVVKIDESLLLPSW